MSRILWAVCVSCALLGFGLLGARPSLGEGRTLRPAPSPRGELPVKVLTWNIGKMHWRWDSRAADADLPHIADVIARERPDLVALQELRDAAQLRRLLRLIERATGVRYGGRVAHEKTYDRRVGILVRGGSARFRTVTTSSGRTALAARMELGGSVSGLAPSVDLVLISVHVDAFDQARRQEQVEEILGWARARFPTEEVDLLALGDFNLNVTGNPGRGRGVSDERLHRLITRHFVDLGPSEPTSVLGVRLDYVFGRAPRLRRSQIRVIRGARINFMDHDPVAMTLHFQRRRPRHISPSS
jgi:endonuclease/exonuclease/phosphatase family metal-dependent hydrolase